MIHLLHADGALPNLALMRLATYFRGLGERVRIARGRNQRQLWDQPGPVFGSSVFDFTDRPALEAEWGPIRWGGTGVSVTSSLSEVDAATDWESVRPDYSDYPGEARSIGFTQRGCRLRCSFCVVPRKEGRPTSVHTLHDIWRGPPHPKKIVLLDNDFFGQPEWRERVEEAVAGDFRICFTQGINIRLITDESASALARVQYRDLNFRQRMLYTAWDNLGDERAFKAGVATLAAAGVSPKHLRVYMLIGYAKGETLDQIRYRFDEMVALGCEPYPMVYDRSRGDLKAFARWAITGLYRIVPWSEYRDPRKEAA